MAFRVQFHKEGGHKGSTSLALSYSQNQKATRKQENQSAPPLENCK